jgi:hypothetical protein
MKRYASAASVCVSTAVVLGTALGTAASAGADTTDLIPDLPPLQQTDGSTGSLLNRNLGTGDQLFCSDIGAEIARLGAAWADAVAANAEAVAGDDAAAAAAARALANTLRIRYVNANGANGACLTAADAALTSSPEGSSAP